MNTAKVVIREVQGYSGFQVRQLFAERIPSLMLSNQNVRKRTLCLHQSSIGAVRQFQIAVIQRATRDI